MARPENEFKKVRVQKRSGSRYYSLRYWDTEKKNWVWQSTRTTDRNEAEAMRHLLEEELLGRLRDRTGLVTKDIDVFFRDYLRTMKVDGRRPRTRDVSAQAWERFRELTGVTDLDRIDIRMAEKFKAELVSRGLAAETVNGHLRRLHAIFEFAVSHGYTKARENPFNSKKVKRLPAPQTIPDYLSEFDIERLIRTAADHSRDALWIVLLGIYAGLRRAEIGAARWEWFDWKANLLKVSSYPGFKLKDKDDRAIPLNNVFHTCMKPYAKREGQVFRQAIPQQKRNAEAELRGEDPPCRYLYDPYKPFETVALAAGFARKRKMVLRDKRTKAPLLNPDGTVKTKTVKSVTIGLHTLRRTFASELVQQKANTYHLMEWLGHTSMRTTQRYAFLAERFDDTINAIHVPKVLQQGNPDVPDSVYRSRVAPSVRGGAKRR